MWSGLVTPRVLFSLLLVTGYCLLIVVLDHQYWRPLRHLDVTLFEYIGVVARISPGVSNQCGPRALNGGRKLERKG
jgi:predicted membrane chloride channel (bestrophin family)